MISVKHLCEGFFGVVAVAAAFMVMVVLIFEYDEYRKQQVYLGTNRSNHGR
jgi:hypothetical protein